MAQTRIPLAQLDTTIVSLSAIQSVTNKDLTGAGNTFPTFNQNTTGSAAKLTTARTIAGTSFDGSANISLANKFIVQGTADTGLSGPQFLGALGTGIVKNTTTTGILSIAVAADFPTLNQSTTGSAATLTTSRNFSIAGSTGLTATAVGFNGSADVALTLAGTLSTGNLSNSTRDKYVTLSLDGQGTAITTGTKGYGQVPYTGTIQDWYIVADQSGSIVIDVWKVASAVPTVTNTITASAKPTLSAAQSAFAGAITGWTTAVTAGDVFGFSVTSATTVTRVTLGVRIRI